MWIEFTNVYGLPEGFRLEDVICAGCNSTITEDGTIIESSKGAHWDD